MGNDASMRLFGKIEIKTSRRMYVVTYRLSKKPHSVTPSVFIFLLKDIFERFGRSGVPK